MWKSARNVTRERLVVKSFISRCWDFQFTKKAFNIFSSLALFFTSKFTTCLCCSSFPIDHLILPLHAIATEMIHSWKSSGKFVSHSTLPELGLVFLFIFPCRKHGRFTRVRVRQILNLSDFCHPLICFRWDYRTKKSALVEGAIESHVGETGNPRKFKFFVWDRRVKKILRTAFIQTISTFHWQISFRVLGLKS